MWWLSAPKRTPKVSKVAQDHFKITYRRRNQPVANKTELRIPKASNILQECTENTYHFSKYASQSKSILPHSLQP